MNLMYKKLFSLVVPILLIFSTGASAYSEDSWLKVQGYEQRKDFEIDRGEACIYAVKLYESFTGKEVPPAVSPYNDVFGYEANYVGKAHSIGIISGEGDNSFYPHQNVTRAEYSEILYNTVKSAFPGAALSGGENVSFPDHVPDYAVSALQFMFSRGIFGEQKKNYIAAYKNLTLGEAVDMTDKLKNAAPSFAVLYDKFNDVPEPETGKIAYITFDDGISDNTSVILDTLKQYNAKATFFITGKGNEELLLRIGQEGHAVGNHTYTHDYKKIYANAAAFWEDFNIEQNFIESVLGTRTILMRFPGGSNNTVSKKYGGSTVMKEIIAQANANGYLYFDWNVSGGDATGTPKSKDAIVSAVLEQSKNKEKVVILLHQSKGHANSAAALPEIIEGLRAMGFSLQPLSEASFRPQFAY